MSGIQKVTVFNLRGPAKKSSSLKSLLPLRVKPNPLDLHFFLQRMYSLKPPGPAHTSAKYNNGFSLFTIGEPSVYPVDKAILFRAGVLNLFHLYTSWVQQTHWVPLEFFAYPQAINFPIS